VRILWILHSTPVHYEGSLPPAAWQAGEDGEKVLEVVSQAAEEGY
jgi:hypothetical protein